MKILSGIAAALLWSLPAWSATIVGSSVVNGRNIEILSDNTWRFELPAPKGCNALNTVITFCGDPDKWHPRPTPTNEILVQYMYDAKRYGQFVFENLGSEDGLTFEYMRSAVIQNAARAYGGDISKVKVLDSFDSTLAGHPAMTIVYSLRVKSLPVVFSNTVLVDKKLSMQAMTFEIATEYSDKHKEIHLEFLQSTKLTLPE